MRAERCQMTAYFNPLPPHGGRPRMLPKSTSILSFQSTPSAWRETEVGGISGAVADISIHSLRMEGDPGNMLLIREAFKFQSTPSAWRETGSSRGKDITGLVSSIHSLRMEGDSGIRAARYSRIAFQSTPSAWRETQSQRSTNGIHIFQSTPSAWRETYNSFMRSRNTRISIHSLRMEGDRSICSCTRVRSQFQSTPSAWRETAALEKLSSPTSNFNPLPPHGGRPQQNGRCCSPCRFQSTPSAWRETCCRCRSECCTADFNPLPPHGGRRRIFG